MGLDIVKRWSPPCHNSHCPMNEWKGEGMGKEVISCRRRDALLAPLCGPWVIGYRSHDVPGSALVQTDERLWSELPVTHNRLMDTTHRPSECSITPTALRDLYVQGPPTCAEQAPFVSSQPRALLECSGARRMGSPMKQWPRVPPVPQRLAPRKAPPKRGQRPVECVDVAQAAQMYVCLSAPCRDRMQHTREMPPQHLPLSKTE